MNYILQKSNSLKDVDLFYTFNRQNKIILGQIINYTIHVFWCKCDLNVPWSSSKLLRNSMLNSGYHHKKFESSHLYSDNKTIYFYKYAEISGSFHAKYKGLVKTACKKKYLRSFHWTITNKFKSKLVKSSL